MLGRRNADKALPESKEKEKNEGEDGWHEEDLTWESLSVDKQEIILSEKDKIIKISLQACADFKAFYTLFIWNQWKVTYR